MQTLHDFLHRRLLACCIPEISNASEIKIRKTASSILKSAAYLIIFFLLTPPSIQIYGEWFQNGFYSSVPSTLLNYCRLVLTFLSAFYVFDLTNSNWNNNNDRANNNVHQQRRQQRAPGVHHGIAIIVIMLAQLGHFLFLAHDAKFLVHLATLAAHIFSLNFIFCIGMCFVRLMEPCKRKLALLKI